MWFFWTLPDLRVTDLASSCPAYKHWHRGKCRVQSSTHTQWQDQGWESENARKHTLVQEKTIMVKKTCSRLRNRSRKKGKFFLFFLEPFLGRERVYLSEFFFSWTSTFFLERMRVFLFSYFIFIFLLSIPSLEYIWKSLKKTQYFMNSL